MKNDNADEMVEVLYGLADDRLAYDVGGVRRSRRLGVTINMEPPPPGDVTIRRRDGSSEIRPMTKAELAMMGEQ